MNNKTKKAFTFAELMIVVSVIAIIASFMIPALVKAEPNETAIRFKKALFAVEQGVASIINDTELYPDFGYDNRGYTFGLISKTNIPGLDAEGQIEDYEDDETGAYLCANLADKMNTVGLIQCSGAALTNLNNTNMTDATTNFILTNGVSIGGINGGWTNVNDDGTIADTPFITLCIDINNSEPPNRGCAIADRANDNRDQFRIRINEEGKVYTGSSVGNNNFYMENKLLLNPRAVTVSEPLNTAERNEVVKTTATNIETPNCNPDLGFVPVDDGNACLYTAGYTDMQLRGVKVGAVGTIRNEARRSLIQNNQ